MLARPEFSTPRVITISAETPKTRFTAYLWPRAVLGSALSDRHIFIPIFGEIAILPKHGDKSTSSCIANHIGRLKPAAKSASGASCLGPCARHGKEQQVVSCPPRRRRTGRLSLRFVRPSVERHDLAGGGAPLPTPSPRCGSALLPARDAYQPPQPQVRGDARLLRPQVRGEVQ